MVTVIISLNGEDLGRGSIELRECTIFFQKGGQGEIRGGVRWTRCQRGRGRKIGADAEIRANGSGVFVPLLQAQGGGGH